MIKFIKDRRLELPNTTPRRLWATLVARLEEADEDATSERFMDLPPELRERIASYYMADLESPVYKEDGDDSVCMPANDDGSTKRVLEHPTQPPLTQTCRLLRQETLPLFYKNCTFMIHLKGNPGNILKYYCRPGAESRAWLEAMEPENIKMLRNLSVFVDMRVGFVGPFWTFDHYRFTCELRIGSSAVKDIPYKLVAGTQCKVVDRMVMKAVDGELKKIAKKIEARDGPDKFRMRDIGVMLERIESCYIAHGSHGKT